MILSKKHKKNSCNLFKTSFSFLKNLSQLGQNLDIFLKFGKIAFYTENDNNMWHRFLLEYIESFMTFILAKYFVRNAFVLFLSIVTKVWF